MFACYRRLSTSSPRSSLRSTLRRLGLPFVYTYGAISLVELPVFFALAHYTGIDWMQDWELRLRSAAGASTDPQDTWIHKANENKGGKFMAELATVLVLHKLFIVVRMPMAVALAPVARRAFHKSTQLRSMPHPPAQTRPSGVNQDPMRRFGTPPNKRNRWFAWFF